MKYCVHVMAAISSMLKEISMENHKLLSYMRKHFAYCGDTGHFTTVLPQSNANKVGDIVGRTQDNGYHRISIKRKFFQAHRLVWLWHHGEMPTGCIDHINGNKSDNRIENLRDCSQQLNARNVTKARKNNKLGVLGVTRAGKRFKANIWSNGASVLLGVFDSIQDASAAYWDAKRKLHKGAVL